MNVTDILEGLKNKVLDAAHYDLLRRNYELLEENNQQLKERLEFLKEEFAKLKKDNLNLSGKVGGLQAEVDLAAAAEQYIVEQGVAFKKRKDGKVDPNPRCPKCHDLLSTIDNSIFVCTPCDYTMSVWDHPVDIAKKINGET